jgi:hypothetical protein
MTSVDRPLTAVRSGPSREPVTVLDAILFALAPLVQYVLPVGGLAVVVVGVAMIHPAAAVIVAGLAMLVLDWQIKHSGD